MNAFSVNEELFGRYARIPTDFSREMHIYKVVTLFQSNYYCDIPICVGTVATHHDSMVEVVNVVHCGINESKVIRVALSDCELLPDENAKICGRWIYRGETAGKKGYECSACHSLIYGAGNYCKHCGAFMNGVRQGCAENE